MRRQRDSSAALPFKKLRAELVQDLSLDLREIGVAITPGIDFDPVRGNRFVRLSYAGPHAAMREAATRIKRWLKG
jgi:aspartate/methionine/tyrosine aminotransferase